MKLQWLVDDNPRHQRVAAAAISALGPDATTDRVPSPRICFVFDVASLPTDVRDRERTILLNADRSKVLELLEAHDPGGAIECEDHDAWATEGARMFVRKDVADLRRGTLIGGPGRESEHYVLWTWKTSLAELVRDYTITLGYFATRFDELVITPDDARGHQLPAVGMRMTSSPDPDQIFRAGRRVKVGGARARRAIDGSPRNVRSTRSGRRAARRGRDVIMFGSRALDGLDPGPIPDERLERLAKQTQRLL